MTLVASLSSANTFKGILGSVMTVLTPLLAACMAIVSGISQAFQWGAAWSDQVITATRLEKDRDRIAVTPASQLDPVKEMQTLDDAILSETQGVDYPLNLVFGVTLPYDARLLRVLCDSCCEIIRESLRSGEFPSRSVRDTAICSKPPSVDYGYHLRARSAIGL